MIRMKQRKINLGDIYAGIDNGIIIEQYPNDMYFPSCLMLYCKVNGQPLHFVCSMGNNKIYIITAYYPDLKHWEDDFMTRKGASK